MQLIIASRNLANAPCAQQILRSAHTVYLCVQNKQRLFHYTALTDWFLITETGRFYCAVRMEVINVIQVNFSLQSLKVPVNRANQFWDVNALAFTSKPASTTFRERVFGTRRVLRFTETC